MAVGNVLYTPKKALYQTDIVDNLVSASSDLPLSAAQGKILNDRTAGLHLAKDTSVYVSAATGSDETGNGTPLKPWRTLQKAVDRCPENGSHQHTYNICIMSGTYDGVTVKNRHIYIWPYGEDTTAPTLGYIAVYNGSYVEIRCPLTIYTTDSHHSLFCGNAYLYTQAPITIENTNKSTYVGISVQHDGAVFINTTLTANNCCTAVSAGYMSRCHIYYVAGSGNEIGFHATKGGKITYDSNTMTAVTPRRTESGGRIYAGKQDGDKIVKEIPAGGNVTIQTYAGGVYSVATVMSLSVTMTYSLVFGGNANQINTGQKACIQPVKTGSKITVEAVNESGKYNQVKVTNYEIYPVTLYVNTLGGPEAALV